MPQHLFDPRKALLIVIVRRPDFQHLRVLQHLTHLLQRSHLRFVHVDHHRFDDRHHPLCSHPLAARNPRQHPTQAHFSPESQGPLQAHTSLDKTSHYAGLVGRRVEVWHGDVSQSRKQRALKNAPDILLTTPESIEAMLISTRVDSRAWFGSLQAVIVDELHAFAADDRGWHLRSVLHRLDQYLHRPLQRIGLSATVSNPQELLEWFAPTGQRTVVGTASVSTDADVIIDHVASLENAATVISRLHRGQKRLVFCDSRSSAEQLCSMLRAREVQTFLSHASLSAAERRQAEAAFVEGRDCAIVATSTLELGIDVGNLDKVIQIDAPSTVSSFLQRMGRTGRRADSRRTCLFLTTNDNALLLALGIAQRWSEAWVEAARPPPQPWPTMTQQAMAATPERGELPNHELMDLLQGSFPELAQAETAYLVEHLVSIGILDRVEAVVRAGPRMEKEFGKVHYRDLLASFSGSMLLTGRHGSAEVGYIDPTVLAGEQEPRLILLGGRSWRVTGIEWSKRTVWLEPAKEGGKARWMGGARSLSREICHGIRTVLAEGPPPSTTLSRRARTALEFLREELCISHGTQFIVSRPQEAAVRTWTFAGTRANRTLARHAAGPGGKVKFDALSVQAPASALAPPDGDDLVLTDDELSVFAETIKFSSCLPHRLLAQTVIARAYEVCGPDSD